MQSEKINPKKNSFILLYKNTSHYALNSYISEARSLLPRLKTMWKPNSPPFSQTVKYKVITDNVTAKTDHYILTFIKLIKLRTSYTFLFHFLKFQLYATMLLSEGSLSKHLVRLLIQDISTKHHCSGIFIHSLFPTSSCLDFQCSR